MKKMAVLAAVAVLALAGCETPTPYQPVASASDMHNGYSSQQIEADRFQVSFSGNSLTSRQTVETYLLYRAAELTVQQGYDWFEMANRDIERHGRTMIDQPFGPGPYGWWSPYWRFRGSRFGWRSWDPNWGDPYWDRADIRTINRYEATAEIVVHKGAKPADDQRAFDARDVMRNLEPQIQRPKTGP